MRRDKKAAKKKKDRANAKKATQRQENRGFAALLKLAHAGDFGPAFMSPEWRDDELPPHILTVVITRKLPNDAFAFHAMVVDRTCLGVKNAFTHAPVSRLELDNFLAQVGKHHLGPMEEVPVATAQSVVIHAIAFAEEYGFEPHRDYDTFMLQPFPDEPVETPLGDPEEPFYVPGPDDDVDAILEQLEDACGPDGFEFGHPNDGTSDDPDDDGPEPRKPDEEALFLALQVWLQELQAKDNDPRLDMTNALRQYVHAATGKPAGGQLSPELMSSLPLFWAGLFRPIGGRTGLELARAKAAPEHAAELERAARTRAALFDVLDIELAEGLLIGRDVFDQKPIKVRLEIEMLEKLTRWTRMFGYVTPMDDDTWYPPSTLLGHPWLRNIEPTEAIARTNALLAELGIDERIDPKAPDTGLLRFGALFHGVLHRSLAPTAEQKAAAEAKVYVVNADDERYELHEATIALDKTTMAKLKTKLAKEETLLFEFATVEPMDDGTLRVTANSASRFDRLLHRLSELAETRVSPKNVDVMRPWEKSDRAVDKEAPGVEKVIINFSELKSEGEKVSFMIDEVRRSLGEDVPALGGRPIDLVKDSAGRERVEKWLREHELRGMPGDDIVSFLDLDDLRRELGLTASR